METELATAASSKGTLASLGHSLTNVGSVTTAFIVAHPIVMGTTGGALLGIMVYRSLGKKFKKKDKEKQHVDVVTA